MGRKLIGKKPFLHTDEDHRGIVFLPRINNAHTLSLANIYSQVDCFLNHGDALETPRPFQTSSLTTNSPF